MNPNRLLSLATVVVALSIAVGTAAGVGAYTFFYAKGGSYLTNDPDACANCHVMQEQLDGWTKSSHRHVAVCNDCHTPEAFIPKMIAKMSNGWHHSAAFTSGDFAEPIRIKASNLEIVERRCRGCHAPIVEAIEGHAGAGEAACVRCHAGVGHP